MQDLMKAFSYGSSQVRTLLNNESVWFVAKDVCDVLEHSDTSTAVKRLDDDEKLTQTMFVSGQNRQMTLINESGLYSLIMTSRKQEARKFKKWVTSEVLPSIRTTGTYTIQLPKSLPEALRAYANEVEAHESTKKSLEQAQPKAEYFDALVDRNLLTNLRDTAKELHMGPKKFNEWLLSKKFLYRDQKGKLKPYAKHVPKLFELKEWANNGKADVQALVTPRGKETFRLLINE